MSEKDLATILASFFERNPQVSMGKHFNATSFLVGRKIFAFLRKEGGVELKLPKAKADELVQKNYALPLVMGKRVMKEWVVIVHSDPEEYKQDKELFRQALAFVRSP